MTSAYRFDGLQDTHYPWGVVRPGDVAYFAGRAPNGDWSAVAAPEPAAPEPAVPAEEDAADVPRRPNKAAPAADWVAYAKAEGSFPDDPDTVTRKAIVDHYCGEGDGGEQ